MPCSNEHVEPIIKDDQNGDLTGDRLEIVPIPEPKDFPDPPPDMVPGDSVPVEDPYKGDGLEPGTQRQYSLNDFELIRVIGRGSYAKVLMVELKKTRRIYAMKVGNLYLSLIRLEGDGSIGYSKKFQIFSLFIFTF